MVGLAPLADYLRDLRVGDRPGINSPYDHVVRLQVGDAGLLVVSDALVHALQPVA